MRALIAGEGTLPMHLHSVLNPPPCVVALEGYPPRGLDVDLTFRIEQLGSLIGKLTSDGISEVCFAGAIRRPPLDPAAVDAATLPLVPRMMAALQSGDDAALRTVLGFFEEAGLAVKGAHELCPDLLPPTGTLSKRTPDDRIEADAARAAAIVSALGPLDVGQGAVVAGGLVLATEALAGTDHMLRVVKAGRSAGPLAFPADAPKGGVLYKAPKPGQDRRVDLPAIGAETLRNAAAAGLDAVVIEAGGVMVLDRDATVAAADDAGVVLWVRP